MTLVSSMAYAQTPATALNFDGTDDYVDAGTDAIFDYTSTSTFTIEAWIKPSITTSVWQVIAARESWDANQGWILHTSSDAVIFRTPSGDIQTSALLNTGSWNYVVVVYNATSVTIYVNEVSVATGTLALNSAGSQSMYIGARHTNPGGGSADFTNGDVSEVRFWSTARTISELGANKDCSLIGSETDLLTFYNFNQGFDNMDNSTDTTLISSNTSYNGTLNNFALTGTTSNYLEVTGTGFGADLDTCTLSNATNELTQGLSLYPNPVKGAFTLQNENNSLELASAVITDINGRIVSKVDLRNMASSQRIDVSGLNSGLYLIRVQSRDASITKKLIIK